MYTRRALIAGAATAAAAPLLPAQTRTVPPSIAALKSRQGEIKPITNQEREARLERAQRLMTEKKVDAICIAGGTSLQYFANVRWGNSERMLLMILPRIGEPFFVVPAFEEDRAREQISLGPAGPKAQVTRWEEDESPYLKVAEQLKERGIRTGTVGVEETVKFVFSEGITKAATQVSIVNATDITAGCRMIKSPAELALMRLAASVTLEAYEAAWKAIQPGMTNRDFGALITAAHAQLGFQGGAMVLTGEYSALPHGTIKPQVIREGTIVLIDGECRADGYPSDISRTFLLGKPTDKMKQVFDIVRKAQDAALRAARPGLPCEAVDAAARKVITDAGYGPGYKYFTHRLGHGMGMDGHEWPYLVHGNTLPLRQDMTFSDEPGIYIKGEFGVRLEDDMHITENGAELFTPQSSSLETPFAV